MLTQFVQVILPVLGMLAAIAGVWQAGRIRQEKADAKILALETASAADRLLISELKADVDTLQKWRAYERGRSERSDVRSMPSNPDDTRG